MKWRGQNRISLTPDIPLGPAAHLRSKSIKTWEKRAQNAFILDLDFYLVSQAFPNTSVKIVAFVRNAFVFRKIEFFHLLSTDIDLKIACI